MHFDTDALQGQAHRFMPKHLQALMGKAQAAINSGVDDPMEGVARRTFLKVSAASGFALGAFPLVAAAQRAGSATAPAGLKPFEQPSAFVRIDADGTVTVTINRLEFGQGVQTGLPMILAEELDADWSKVRSVHGDANPAYADPAFGMHLTGGSNSLKNSYTQYRELGARTRAMLVSAAAAQWGVDASTLRTNAGFVVGPGGKKLAYGALAVLRIQTNSTNFPPHNPTLWTGSCPAQQGVWVEDATAASPVRIDCLRFKRWANNRDDWLGKNHPDWAQWLGMHQVQLTRPASYISYRYATEGGAYVAVTALVDQRLLIPKTRSNDEFLRSGQPAQDWMGQLRTAVQQSVGMLDGHLAVPAFPLAVSP